MQSNLIELLKSTPLRVVTTTTCNKCRNEVTESFCKHWSCKTCDAWVQDVTQTRKPYEHFRVCV